MNFGITAALLAAVAAPSIASDGPPAAGLFDTDGYRSASFRAPVDRDPAPAQRITLARARLLVPGRDALFIDVLPAEGASRDRTTGRWTLARSHTTIAGALWYPDTGRSQPDPALWRALAARVAAYRRAQPRASIVVFCRADCWMSWNAARRLARGGVPQVRWLAEGIEGWREARGTLVDAQPAISAGP